MNPTHRIPTMGALLALLALAAPAPAQTTLNWRSEAANGNWNDANNWWNGSGTQAPPGSEILRFGNANQLTMNNNLTGTAANRFQIYFDSGSGARTISGSTLNTFYDFSGGTPVIQNDSANTQTINFPIANGNSVGQSLDLKANAGPLVFGGTIEASGGSRTIYPQGSANITFNGVLQNGSGTLHVTKLGTGTLTYTAANTYSGVTTINGGTLNIGSTDRLGAAPGSPTPGNVVLNGGRLAANNVTINANRGISLGASGGILASTAAASVTYNGIIAGAGALTLDATVSGATFVLGGQSTYSGGTTLSNNTGGLVVPTVNSTGPAGAPTSGPFGTGTLNFAGLQMRASTGADTTIANPLQFSADTTFPNRTDEKSLLFTGPVTLSGGSRVLTVNIGTTVAGKGVELAGAIGDGGGGHALTKAGTGMLTLAGANTFSGGVTLSAGRLNINHAQALGAAAGAFTLNGGFVDNTSGSPVTTLNHPITVGGNFTNIGTGDLNLGTGNVALGSTHRTIGVSAGTLTLGGTLNNSAANVGITKQGAGTLRLTGDNSAFNGGIGSGAGAFNIPAGTLIAAHPAALGAAGQLIGVGGGTLRLATDSSVNAVVINLSSTAGAGTIQSDRATAGAGLTHVLGMGTLGNETLNVTAGPNVTSGTAAITLAGVNLTAGVAGAGAMTLNPTTARLTVTGGVVPTGSLSAYELVLGGTSVGNAINGDIADGAKVLAVTKTNSSTWTLAGTNTHTGATTVKGGTLLVNGSLAAGSAVTVQSGATLGGTGTLNGTLAVNTGGTLSPGTALGTLTVGSLLSLGGTTVMELDAAATPNADKLARSGGTLTFGGVLTVTNAGAALTGGEVFDLFDAPGFGGTFSATNLPSLGAGLNWWAGNLGVDGTLVVNRAPVATNVSFSVAQGDSGALTVIGGKRAPTDPDANPLTITAVGAVSPASAGTAGFTASNVTFNAANDFNGTATFTYTVGDGRGGSGEGTVTVTVTPAASGANLRPPDVSGGTATLDGFGIPGAVYQLQFTTNLTGAVNWADVSGPLASASAAGNGTVSLVDTNASGPMRFYRTRHVSGP